MAYETRRFNTAITKAPMNQINPIPRIDTYLFKVYSNIVLPSTPRPPQRLLSCRYIQAVGFFIFYDL